MTSSKTGQITIRSIGAGGDGVANLPDGRSMCLSRFPVKW
ncbi:TrmA family RNA methyltransferase [Brucella ceti TE28753-12]|nr:TrmA family RNA methyltransferase [Brucella ceti TE28753-12]